MDYRKIFDIQNTCSLSFEPLAAYYSFVSTDYGCDCISESVCDVNASIYQNDSSQVPSHTNPKTEIVQDNEADLYLRSHGSGGLHSYPSGIHVL